MSAGGSRRRRWPGLPISAQILALLMGSLVAAQAVTLALTLVLPPAPPQQHSLVEVARALRGGALGGGDRPLIRAVQAQPPSLQSPGWLVSPRSTRDLAVLLHAPESDVRLLFYAPPPLAGAPPEGPRRDLLRRPATFDFMLSPRTDAGADAFAPPVPGRGFPGPRGPAGPMGGPVGFPSASGPVSAPLPPPGAGSGPTLRRSSEVEASPPPTSTRGAGHTGQPPTGAPATAPARPPDADAPPARAPRTIGPVLPPILIPRAPLDAAVFDSGPEPAGASHSRAQPSPVVEPPPAAPEPPAREPVIPAPTQLPQTPLLAAAAPAYAVPAYAVPAPPAAEDPLASTAAAPLAPPRPSGLFGLAPAAYVEGEFIAALRVAPGRWVTVRPRPEGFPNSWQRRVLLWFALSFAAVAPVGYLLARRLAAPLQHFARAAEVLGRDPTAEVSAREGPAEVGRAARAFNLMQQRLKRYVEDRTAMIGAISHDLRTPLARMRFRLERASPELRAAMSRDIGQMEAMISAVLVFMRDEAVGARRERADLRSILEVVADDAHAEGADVELAPGPTVEVDVDLVAVQRVFENLISNAVKYGGSARARLYVEAGEAVAEITDPGPGLPQDELESVFRPFYRTPEARASDRGGVGLGLTVSRSTIRAHGGELSLANGTVGLVARVRLPLAVAGGSHAVAA